MKNVKLFLAALLAVAVSAPAFAQSQDPHANEKWNNGKVTAAIERVAVKAQQARRTNPYFKGGDPHNAANYEKCRWCGEPLTDENLSRRCPADPDVHCLPAPKSDAKAHTCYRCGKSFRAGQHCSAADYTALCANSPEQERQLNKTAAERKAAAEKASTCPKCGEAYTIDERYHGVEHECKSISGGNGGEPQTAFLCEADPDALYRAEELLQADRDAHNGNAVHTLEYYYQQTAGKAPAKTSKAKKAKTEYCIYCGEAIVKDGQVCTAQGYGCRCTTNCPDCGQNLRDSRHTINGEHRCKFKTRIKVAPIKKAAK